VTRPLDAVVVGSGPNGLAAAITLARAGRSVRVYEAETSVGGGTRSAALTEPGFVHDVCSTVFALALSSPFLKTLPLAEHGLAFAHPDSPFAHPLDDGTAVVVERSVDATAESLGAEDARS
jgi:phytoene dehydrogenase-like protein